MVRETGRGGEERVTGVGLSIDLSISAHTGEMRNEESDGQEGDEDDRPETSSGVSHLLLLFPSFE